MDSPKYDMQRSPFLINRTEEGRKLIYEALLTQMEADLENGYNSILNETPEKRKTDILQN